MCWMVSQHSAPGKADVRRKDGWRLLSVLKKLSVTDTTTRSRKSISVTRITIQISGVFQTISLEHFGY